MAAHGYAEAEYLLEGTATRYRLAPGAQLTRDGHWKVEPAGTAPFRTRMLVYRPNDGARFNGTVVLTWNNVTAGHDRFGAESRERSRAPCAGAPDDPEGGHRGSAAGAAKGSPSGPAVMARLRS
jgi:hypothetical protein